MTLTAIFPGSCAARAPVGRLTADLSPAMVRQCCPRHARNDHIRQRSCARAEPLKRALQPFCDGPQMFFPLAYSRSDSELESCPGGDNEERNGNRTEPIPRDIAASVIRGIVWRHDIDFEFHRPNGNGVEDNDHPDLPVRTVALLRPENLAGHILLFLHVRPGSQYSLDTGTG